MAGRSSRDASSRSSGAPRIEGSIQCGFTDHVIVPQDAHVIYREHMLDPLGLGHVALEVSYSTYPAILQTIDLLAAEVKPRLA